MGEILPIARQVLRAGTWQESEMIGLVRLDYDGRRRRRRRLVTECGRPFLLDLANTMQLADGDALVLEDGALIRVVAETEALFDIHTHEGTSLLRIVWHLGNRHLPVEIVGEHLRIRTDHVIAKMIEQLGGHVESVRAVFTPEAGAYADEARAHSHSAHDHHDGGDLAHG